MDPDACFKLVTDETLPLDERGQAAVDLLSWLAKEGSVPGATATAHSEGQRRAVVVEKCQIVLAKVLDALPEED